MNKSSTANLNVTFLGCSKDPIEILYSSSKIRQSPDDAAKIWQQIQSGEITREAMVNYAAKNLGSNYQTPLKQAQFLFVVDNISQIGSSYFNRQQIESDKNNIAQSYLELQNKDQTAVTPPSFQVNPELLEKWSNLQTDIVAFYNYCRDQGVEADDAGFALPRGLRCREQISMSFQTMQRFLDQKMCEKIQWEINELSWQIFQIMKKEFPTLAKRLGIKCWENRNLFCDEPHQIYESCKWHRSRPHKDDLNSLWARENNLTSQAVM